MIIDEYIIDEYSGQDGYGNLNYFVGRQYGAGWLRNLARIAFPFFKKAISTAGNIASNTASDLLKDENRGFTESLRDNAIKEAGNLLTRKRSAPINRSKNKKKKKSRYQV